jgi:cytidylate kinase
MEELRAAGLDVSYDETLRDLVNRDDRDQNRPIGALRAAEGAMVIDSSNLTIDDVVRQLEERVRRLHVNGGSVRIP